MIGQSSSYARGAPPSSLKGSHSVQRRGPAAASRWCVGLSGALAPHSHLRGAIIPTPRQQGVEDVATDTGSPRWSWARLLKRVFALEMARCPCCQRGALRIIAAITHSEVMRKILQHLKLSADPPPIALARVRQEAFAWPSA
jgi:hypothetical protein